MNIPIGWIIALGCALGGYALHGGNILVLWQPTEVLTIVGAAVGTMIASNNITNLKKTFAALGGAFKTKSAVKQMHLDLLCLMFEILQKIKRDGLMSLEGDIEEPESSPLFEKYPSVTKDHHLVDFITDYLRMMLGGSLDVIQVESLMEQELEVHHQEAHIPVASVTNVADGLPAFGIVAAVMGVVHTMGSIGLPPAELGVDPSDLAYSMEWCRQSQSPEKPLLHSNRPQPFPGVQIVRARLRVPNYCMPHWRYSACYPCDPRCGSVWVHS
ncbi:MAG: flagellar motor stator protein MotA [Burkholderiaceae bacterium]|nr:flagellar motor stator protein MotA [Burkholderiaceae bacterium]